MKITIELEVAPKVDDIYKIGETIISMDRNVKEGIKVSYMDCDEEFFDFVDYLRENNIHVVNGEDGEDDFLDNLPF